MSLPRGLHLIQGCLQLFHCLGGSLRVLQLEPALGARRSLDMSEMLLARSLEN